MMTELERLLEEKESIERRINFITTIALLRQYRETLIQNTNQNKALTELYEAAKGEQHGTDT